jgi:predicted dehydrogenase
MPRSLPSSRGVDRRTFLMGALAAGVASAQPFWARPALRSPNGKLRLAAVGCGGMGGSDLRELVKHPMLEVAALCDIDRNTLADQGKKHPQAKTFTDYRELFAGDTSKFDAVLCSTPDHQHAPVIMRALRAKKHVYGQKPLTRTLWEARQLRLEAAKQGVVTQMGIQLQATAGRRAAAALMAGNVTGKVSKIHIWTNRPAGWWPQGENRPAGTDPVPAHLDWESWLGVAPSRPYKDKAYAPFKWRGVLDFGTGALGDMGCHFFDTPFETLGMMTPLSAKADVEKLTDDQWPLTETVELELAGTARTTDKVKLIWTDGGRVPTGADSSHLPKDFDGGKFSADGGSVFIGEAATFVVPYSGKPMLYAEGKAVELKEPDVKAYDHWHAWVDACLGKGKTAANFEFAGPVTEAVLLGAVAGRVPGVKIEYDAANCSIKGSDAAAALVKPKYRDGWSVPDLG